MGIAGDEGELSGACSSTQGGRWYQELTQYAPGSPQTTPTPTTPTTLPGEANIHFIHESSFNLFQVPNTQLGTLRLRH